MTQRQVHSQFFLKAEGLACGRGEQVLVSDIALDLAPGAGLLLRGPNGAGKSTLLLTLAGLLPPLAGRVDYRGHDPDEAPPLHYCGHRNGVRPRLTTAETLDFWAAINGRTGLPPLEALEKVGLSKAAALDAGYLSAGQQRRLALARLLVSRRPLWLLDEPTAALDAEGHRLVADLVGAHLAAGGIAVIATHDDIAVSGLVTLTLGTQP
ncbi:heme ABC exporter ATP-binding protein CcmA [Devosia sp. YIM 151766]|uniref:heme ABC exporter ATP-binding protein CcmA n=1 Tax=Devosia sp. YIM 151766 TaxID=3017325 RepID=UPI00255C8473|nr:heme ABC exporter ATP-binding protein CcmA [Devosia sp. YIM 151766]WIY52799.1 heme ABC exporter ATP-binding protein CcmA [Devosia sp. YIM 151766]